MYIQDLFREARTDELHKFIRTFSLGTLIVGAPTLEAHPLPMEIVGHDPSTKLKTGLGVVRTHISRRNLLWTTTAAGTEVLTVFQSPNAYISPRWYVNGQRSGRVAPSWNYMTVHARGPIRFIEDEQWMRDHLASLTEAQEAARSNPWKVADAPPDFVLEMTNALVGVEIAVTSLEGKIFLSQQRTAADRQNIVQHLRKESSGSASDVAAYIEAKESGRLYGCFGNTVGCVPLEK